MTSHGVFYLFVYGSLRSGFQSQAYDYISRYFTLAGEAKVRGKLYDMGNYPAALPSNDESFIIGELYKIKNENEFSWAMGQLDDYEGIDPEFDEVQLYRRDLTDVFFNDQPIKAWIYWYTGNVSGKPVVASGDIMEYIKNKIM